MDDDDFDWSIQPKHQCMVCKHIEYNEDKEENEFVRFEEKLHSESDDGSIKTWTQLMCPKCNHLIVDRW